ncbi:hypothetical protein HMI55_006068 [Coelomomyces lativittatus]|nr:hypothetical protein HMI55_006068 [Coelomomyces lativittatus]
MNLNIWKGTDLFYFFIIITKSFSFFLFKVKRKKGKKKNFFFFSECNNAFLLNFKETQLPFPNFSSSLDNFFLKKFKDHLNFLSYASSPFLSFILLIFTFWKRQLSLFLLFYVTDFGKLLMMMILIMLLLLLLLMIMFNLSIFFSGNGIY